MKKEPILVIMAAGMGSRYGGIKQIDPIGANGEIIIDYSLYDARRAGFKKVVFIIREEIKNDFMEVIGNRAEKYFDCAYAMQDLNDIPEGFTVPEGRSKPWGTGHAIYAARHLIDAPFAVINADDFYGREAFQLIYDKLANLDDSTDVLPCTMVGYILKNTLTDNGFVSRGECTVNEQGYLTDITERVHIEKRGDGAAYTEDGGKTWVDISPETTVSMNLFGFPQEMIHAFENGIADFLTDALKTNPLKGEYFLPFVVNDLLKAGKATVEVMRSGDKWYGVTYQEDKPVVQAAVRKLTEDGVYPTEKLLG